MVLKFLAEAINEFKKVEWPTRRQALRLTAYVVGVSVVVGLYVSAVDHGFTEALGYLLTL